MGQKYDPHFHERSDDEHSWKPSTYTHPQHPQPSEEDEEQD